MTTFARAALSYAARGWAVFPLVPKGKLPLIPADPEKAAARGWPAAGHGCKDATTNPEQIRQWWRIRPDANVGVATGPKSKLLVIDLDGPEAAETFKARYPVADPVIQRTKRGWHLCYAWTDDCEGISISAGQLGAGIDMRGAGGYIVVAPSVREDGPCYAWLSEGDPSPPAPELIAACRKRERKAPKFKPALFERGDGKASRFGEAVIDGLCRKLIDARDGHQEKLLNWCAYRAGNLVGGGEAAAGYAFDRLAAVARGFASYDPSRPWLAQEIEAKIARAIEQGKAEPRRAESYRVR